MHVKSSMLKQRAEYQAGRHFFMHGMQSGLYYGGAAGLVMAVYHRRVSYLPKIALTTGVLYGSLLFMSNMYRFDI
jgi:hypothetical protein